MEPFYPLRALVCEQCLLVQLEEFETPEAIFSDYAYFSSYSTSWLEHSRRYVEQMVERWGLGRRRARSSRSPPTTATCCSTSSSAASRCSASSRRRTSREVAVEKGVPTLVEFFGVADRRRGWRRERQADLLLGNNVLAHVPDLNDFVGGMKVLLAPDGVITMEFPHLLRLIEDNQFDTIYHEHFSYFSFLTVRARVRRPRPAAVRRRGAADPRRLAAHLRRPRRRRRQARDRPRARAAGARGGGGLGRRSRPTATTPQRVERRQARRSLEFLIDLKRQGKSIVGYGAPAKGNTLLNYCGVAHRLPRLHRRRQPAQAGPPAARARHIPIRPLEALRETRPDVVADPAVEPARGDHGAARLRPGVGRAVRGAGARAAPAAVIVRATPLDGVYVVEQERLADERGFVGVAGLRRDLQERTERCAPPDALTGPGCPVPLVSIRIADGPGVSFQRTLSRTDEAAGRVRWVRERRRTRPGGPAQPCGDAGYGRPASGSSRRRTRSASS